MKLIFAIYCMSAIAAQFAVADEVTDPVKDYAYTSKLAPGRIVLKWEIDLKNDGNKEILLDRKLSPDEIALERRMNKGEYNSNVRSFRIYIPNAIGYVESKGVDDGDGLGLGVAPSIDITQCYVGRITQLNKWGLVTIQTDYGATQTTVYIYAYTIKGNHLKRVLLAKYNPGKKHNAIYDQYLKNAHRTLVTLQEVTP